MRSISNKFGLNAITPLKNTHGVVYDIECKNRGSLADLHKGITVNMNQKGELNSKYIPKILVLCDRKDTAPIWGHILRRQGLITILEISIGIASRHFNMPVLVFNNPTIHYVKGKPS